MILPQFWLRQMNPKVYDLVQPFKVISDAQMPLAYRRPNGRFLHDDWAIFKDTPRIETAYRVPGPFKLIEGNNAPAWMPWDPAYPQSPGLQTEIRPYTTVGGTYQILHALIDQAVEDSGYATFACWLNGRWMPCFQSYRKIVFGRRLAKYTGGLKMDVTVSVNPDGSIKSDIMGWFDPPTVSWNTVS